LREPNFERLFEELFVPMLPREITGKHVRAGVKAGMVAGGGFYMGATFGGGEEFDWTDPEVLGWAVIGAAMGGWLGTHFATGLELMIPNIPAQDVFRRLLTVERGLPHEFYLMDKGVKLKRAGLSREAFDVGRETGKEYAKDPELAAVIYKALKGEVAFTAIENKKIRNGAVNIRTLLDEMRNDIVRYMALAEENPALAKKMLENTGYLPAKYEIFENPELLQIVADNIRKKGLNIERMGQRTYLWHALPEELVPPEILETKILNAGYLLGKQGPAVQADLTMAEIAWRTAAHPEWTLSDELAAGITKTLVGPQGKRRFRQIVHSPVSVRTKLVTKGKERALDVVEVRVVDAADPTKVVDDLGVMRRGRVNHNNIKRDYLPEPPPGYSAFREYGRDLIKTPDGKRRPHQDA
jgi:hypothetical protein